MFVWLILYNLCNLAGFIFCRNSGLIACKKGQSRLFFYVFFFIFLTVFSPLNWRKMRVFWLSKKVQKKSEISLFLSYVTQKKRCVQICSFLWEKMLNDHETLNYTKTHMDTLFYFWWDTTKIKFFFSHFDRKIFLIVM